MTGHQLQAAARSTLHRVTAPVVATLVLAACGGSEAPANTGGGGANSGGANAAGANPGGAGIGGDGAGSSVGGAGGFAGWLANKPDHLQTHMTTLDFSQDVPPWTGPRVMDTAIPGSDWFLIFDDNLAGTGTNFTALSDATEPVSGPGAWELHFEAGTFDDGHGAGNIFYPMSEPEFYFCMAHWWDPDYVWHPVSNKFLNLSDDNFLIQSKESDRWLAAHNLQTAQLYPTIDNSPIELGVWHVLEVYLKKGTVDGRIQIWLDGVLRTDITGDVRGDGGDFGWFGVYGFRGGGGETLPHDIFQRFGQIELWRP
jgi:hypothetical protein